MPARYIVKILNANNNQSLLDFYDKPLSNKGRISLILDYSPDIWNSLSVEGDTSEILMVNDTKNNKVAGVVILSQKLCYFHGKIHNVGYVSGLRVTEDYQGTVVIALLFKAFKEYCKKNDLKIWFYSVFKNNEKGLKLFSKSNKRLPVFEPIVDMKTYIFKHRYLPNTKDVEGIYISPGGNEDIDDIVEFIKLEGNSRAHLPAYSVEQIHYGKGLLNGMSVSDLAVASKNGKIIGIMGLWNQSVFRRWKVMGYSNTINALLPIINISTKLLGYPKLPAIYCNIEYNILSLMIIQNDDIEVFKILFNFLMKNYKGHSKTFSISLKSDSDLIKYFSKRSVAFSNTIYKTYWKEDEDSVKELNIDNLYIEQGGL